MAGYVFNAGKQSQSRGADLFIYPWLSDPQRSAGISAVQRAVLCDAIPKCVGFNSNGLLKSSLLPLEPWPNAGPCDGVFIKAAPEAPDCAPLADGGRFCSYCLASGRRLTCRTSGATSCKARISHLPPRVPRVWASS